MSVALLSVQVPCGSGGVLCSWYRHVRLCLSNQDCCKSEHLLTAGIMFQLFLWGICMYYNCITLFLPEVWCGVGSVGAGQPEESRECGGLLSHRPPLLVPHVPAAQPRLPAPAHHAEGDGGLQPHHTAQPPLHGEPCVTFALLNVVFFRESLHF